MRALIALTAFISCTAQAQHPHHGELADVVNLQAEASREVENDQLVAVLAAEAQGANPAELAETVNRKMAEALKSAKEVPSVKLRSGNYQTFPQRGKEGRIEGWQVLLTRRTDALRHHAGQVSFPGGRIEAGDADAIAAALRESREEIGLLSAQAAPLGFLDPLCTITGFRVSSLVAMVDAEFVARPDPGEVAEVFEVPLDYILDPANLATLEITTVAGRPIPGGRPRRVLEFVDRGNPKNRIWGATASILFNLRERIASATTAG